MDDEQQGGSRRKEHIHRANYFKNAARIEAERAERLATDPDYKKRFILRCVSGGFGRGGAPKAKITLTKMSWDK